MTARSQVGRSLTEFTDNIGIPDLLWSDGAPKMTGNNTEFVREANRLKIRQRITEQGRRNQNHASEREIGELKKRWRNRMIKKKIPRRVWDYGLVYEADLLRFIPRGNFGRTAYEEVTGQTPDISEWTDFEMWDLVWFWDQAKVDLGVDNRRLGRWLGVSHHVGSDLSYWIITNNGKVLSRTTVQHAIRDDYLNMDTKTKIDTFNTEIEARLDDTNFLTDEAGEAAFYIEDDYDTGGVDRGTTPTDVEYDDMITEEVPEYEEDVFDKYIGAELIMNVDSYNEQQGRVVKRVKGLDGTVIGREHTNPLFDTREYVIEFTDGTQENYLANIIAENMYAKVDSEGNQYQLLDEISDHRKDASAIPIADGFTRSKNGNAVPKVTTRGWELLCNWKDGSTSWVKLKDIKDSYPIEIAEYAVANRIADKPAFNWWTKSVLRKRNRIIAKLKSKYWTRTHKFGIQVPKSAEQALQLDKEAGNDLWRKAINKEMDKAKVAWVAREDVPPELVRQG